MFVSMPRGKRLWAVPLPAVCVGMDTIPGGKGGCIVGTGEKAELLHFAADGLLIGSVGPGEAMAKQSGWFDNHACVAVNRDRRDGILEFSPRTILPCELVGIASTTAESKPSSANCNQISRRGSKRLGAISKLECRLPLALPGFFVAKGATQ